MKSINEILKEQLDMEQALLDSIKFRLSGTNQGIESLQKEKAVCEENISKLRFDLNKREEEK